MKKIMGVFLASLLLIGCVTTSQKAEQASNLWCSEMDAGKGTENWAVCRMNSERLIAGFPSVNYQMVHAKVQKLCKESGFKPKTLKYSTCYGNTLIAHMNVEYQKNNQAQQGLQTMLEGVQGLQQQHDQRVLNQAYINSLNRPKIVNTNCTQYGQKINCTSF